MLVEDLLGRNTDFGTRELLTIQNECSQFLKETGRLPLFKSLPKTYKDFHRVKVRQQKRNDNVAEAFNKAFGSQFSNLRQRAVFAYPTHQHTDDEQDLFYVFLPDGYKFLYSKEVKNSSSDYKRVIDTLFEQFEDNGKTIEVVTDLLKYTYSREGLLEGIISESEIIFYGVPYFYAVRCSTTPPYGQIWTR